MFLTYQVTLCGPWIANGSLATHTATEYGSINTIFTSHVVLTDLGGQFIIGHLKIGNMQIAIGKAVVGIAPLGKCANLLSYAVVHILLPQCVVMEFVHLALVKHVQHVQRTAAALYPVKLLLA